MRAMSTRRKAIPINHSGILNGILTEFLTMAQVGRFSGGA